MRALSETIESEIRDIKRTAEKYSKTLTDDQAFNIMLLQFFCFKEADLDNIWYDVEKCITDGINDGGIDFVFFDEDECKVIIGQNKYSENISVQDCISELHKMINTVCDFYKGHTGKYNKRVKEVLQDAIDRLTDENEGNIDIVFSSLNSVDSEKVLYQLGEELTAKVSDIKFIDCPEIEDIIEKVKSSCEVVKYDAITIDRAKNWLMYETRDQKGIFVNISSKSLARLYNKYANKGLFNLNIRGFIKNKSVDDGIRETLNKHRDQFWFLNNGLTIAARDYDPDGNTVKLYDFSIVNGGQTTTLIGKYNGNNDEEFFIPCKIIASKVEMGPEESRAYFSKIAEATNSQKTIQPRDLKSNAPEMRNLQRMLSSHGIWLEIKRGVQAPKGARIKLKNDVLAQIIYSFVNQKPGTARSNKRSLFDNPKAYKQVFRKNYAQQDKQDFILALIDLNERFDALAKKYKTPGNEHFTTQETNIFFNAKCTLFGLFGVIYRIVNNDVDISELREDPSVIEDDDFIYGRFLSNYREDDIMSKLDGLIKYLVGILAESYEDQYRSGKVTSISNYFKTDKKYTEEIVKDFVSGLNRKKNRDELMEYAVLFNR